MRTGYALLLLIYMGTAHGQADSIRMDSLLAHVRFLASDELRGRQTGTAGNAAAARYITQRFQAYGLKPLTADYRQPFQFYSRLTKQAYKGANLIAMVEGSAQPDSFLVISAHYDHIGVREGAVYNGADDNASGVGALLELARYFQAHPAPYSLIFAAFDAEEMGLQGARHFVDDPPVAFSKIGLNINLDMIGRNANEEIYVCGTSHYPRFRPPLERLGQRADIALRLGHDSPGLGPGGDWTFASDHGAFHRKGVAFLYFGVEDHADYHQPTDDASRIMPAFYLGAANLIRSAIVQLTWPE